MQTLAFKMLFHRRGTASAILAAGLLIALLTSVNCLVNNINAQTAALTRLASVGETYVIKSQNAASLSDSQIDANLIDVVKNASNVKYATNQQLNQATLTVHNQSFTIIVRGVADVKAYLTQNAAVINGSAPKTDSDADVGIIIANMVDVQKNDQIILTVNGQSTQFRIAGVTRTQTQSDSQLIMPLSTLQNLTGQTGVVSYIEFSIRNRGEAYQTISKLTATMPSDIDILSAQQVVQFADDINSQTVSFISVWSIAIYLVVVAAFHVTSSRLIDESGYDLYTLRTLGTTKVLYTGSRGGILVPNAKGGDFA